MAPAIMAIRWAIVAAIFRASMIEARAREAIHAPMATTTLPRAGMRKFTKPDARSATPPPRSASRSPVDSEESDRSEEHTSELQSLMRISYAVFCLKKKTIHNDEQNIIHNATTQKNKSN